MMRLRRRGCRRGSRTGASNWRRSPRICHSISAILTKKESTMPASDTPERWSWPAGRAIVLYHWSWFDQVVGDVVVGWSQRDELDSYGYIHLEEEIHQPARTRQIDRESRDFAVV